MRISRNEHNLLAKTLNSSFDITELTHIARDMIDGYNVYERTNYPENLSIPKRDAIDQIIHDFCLENIYIEFIELLIDIHENGYRGKRYSLINLKGIIQNIVDRGYIYHKEMVQFVENPLVRKTRNWGILQPEKEYTLTFLRIDMVKNSKIVQENSKEIIEKTYGDLRKLVMESVLEREGRLWSWEGDGGIAAFYIRGRHQAATLSAMEILHQVIIYNATSNCLSRPLEVRIAVHNGPFEYSDANADLRKSETVQKVIQIEHEVTKSNSVTISIVIKTMLDDIIARQFQLMEDHGNYQYFNYSVKWEQ